jgi:hypothetical protein
MSVHTRYTRGHIPEDGIFHGHRRENLKSYKPAAGELIVICLLEEMLTFV